MFGVVGVPICICDCVCCLVFAICGCDTMCVACCLLVAVCCLLCVVSVWWFVCFVLNRLLYVVCSLVAGCVLFNG